MKPAVLVTITSTVFIPELTGYWEQSFDILKVCLGSLIANTPGPWKLSVFDNGSCPPVREYLTGLLNSGTITQLHLSACNVGKAAAVNLMFAEADTEYIAYTDSDALFREGWLKESLAVFNAFGRTGIVSGRPWRPMGGSDERLWKLNADLAAGIPGVEVERGDLIPADILDEHARSIHLPVPPICEGRFTDMRITRNGVSAYTFGSHFQYLTSKAVMADVGPLGVGETGLSKSERRLDERISELGYLRLAVTRPLVHHLGNTLVGENEDEIKPYLGDIALTGKLRGSRPRDRLASLFASLARVQFIRRLLLRIQRSLFEALSFRV